jgi:hypothetical protein
LEDEKRHGLRRQKAQQQNTRAIFYRWTRFAVAILNWLIKGFEGVVGRGVSGGGGGVAGSVWEGGFRTTTAGRKGLKRSGFEKS